jgi:hypothetical protein
LAEQQAFGIPSAIKERPMTPPSKALRLLVMAAIALGALACGDSDAGSDAGGGGEGGSAPDGGGGSSADSGSGEDDCTSGCTCDLDESCSFTCGADCTVECLGGTCDASCPEGGCTLDSDFGANATYSCEGGGCAMDCDVASICSLDCSGGGCEVLCDAASTCDVTCSEDGEPCNVTCASGGRATCEGNCVVTDCDLSCEPDPTYMPEIDPAMFTSVITNPLFPMAVGAEWVYQGEDEIITVTVTDMTYTTAQGVECAVVRDTVETPDGELIEDTYDWYAQDAEGNVWYMGEETAEYVNGEVATTAGSWEAGVDGAQPGIIMYAMPEVGDVYYQEYLACEAEDKGEVLEVGVSETVELDSYDDCVRIRDFTPLDSTSNEIKTFCPGVGNVLVVDVATGDRVEELTSYTPP